MAALANRFPHHVKLPDIALRDIAIGMYLLENSRGRAIGFIGPLPLVLVASVVPAHCRSNGTGGLSAGETPDEELARAAPVPCRRRLGRRRPSEGARERDERERGEEERPGA